jgi:peptide/nickel transport system substrate-binding protein
MVLSRQRLIAVVGIAAALALSACSDNGSPSSSSSGSPGSQTAAAGGNLVIDTLTPPVDFNTNTTVDNESIWILEQVAQPLYSNGRDGKSLTPTLATGYTVSSNRTVWTFTLRKGVKFSNGAPLTAKDVVFSLNAARNPKNVFSFVDSAIASVSAPDDSTVVVKTKYPWAPLLADIAFIGNAVVPAKYGGQTAAAFYNHPIGTGPFKFDKYVKGQYVKLVKNPDYWQPGRPHLDSVTFDAIANGNTRVSQLESGQAQVIESAPYSLISSLKSAGFNTGLYPSTRIDYVTMNEKVKQFADVHVRRAISEAVDRAALMKAVFFGQGTVADSPFMPAVTYYTSNAGVLPFSLAQAKHELAKSSYPHGGFSIDFIAAAGDQVQSTVAQIIQQDLKPLNINVNIRSLDPSQVTAQEQSFHFGMRETLWTMDIVDPDEYAGFSFDGSAGSFSNFTHYNNPKVNQLIETAEKTFSSSERASLYAQVQKRVAADAPMVWLGESPYNYPHTSKLQGFYVFPEGYEDLQDAWLSK